MTLKMRQIAIDSTGDRSAGVIYGVAEDGVVYEFTGEHWVAFPMTTEPRVVRDARAAPDAVGALCPACGGDGRGPGGAVHQRCDACGGSGRSK